MKKYRWNKHRWHCGERAGENGGKIERGREIEVHLIIFHKYHAYTRHLRCFFYPWTQLSNQFVSVRPSPGAILTFSLRNEIQHLRLKQTRWSALILFPFAAVFFSCRLGVVLYGNFSTFGVDKGVRQKKAVEIINGKWFSTNRRRVGNVECQKGNMSQGMRQQILFAINFPSWVSISIAVFVSVELVGRPYHARKVCEAELETCGAQWTVLHTKLRVPIRLTRWNYHFYLFIIFAHRFIDRTACSSNANEHEHVHWTTRSHASKINSSSICSWIRYVRLQYFTCFLHR